MKVTITLDAAACFDMMSILQVKLSKLDCVRDVAKWKQVCSAETEMFMELQKQLGDLYWKIKCSPEYRALRDANQKVFDAVDIAEDPKRQNEISAYDVAQLNLLRYECKKKLQQKFFNSAVSEFKTGTYNAV
jgi:hypothetical protein